MTAVKHKLPLEHDLRIFVEDREQLKRCSGQNWVNNLAPRPLGAVFAGDVVFGKPFISICCKRFLREVRRQNLAFNPGDLPNEPKHFNSNKKSLELQIPGCFHRFCYARLISGQGCPQVFPVVQSPRVSTLDVGRERQELRLGPVAYLGRHSPTGQEVHRGVPLPQAKLSLRDEPRGDELGVRLFLSGQYLKGSSIPQPFPHRPGESFDVPLNHSRGLDGLAQPSCGAHEDRSARADPLELFLECVDPQLRGQVPIPEMGIVYPSLNAGSDWGQHPYSLRMDHSVLAQGHEVNPRVSRPAIQHDGLFQLVAVLELRPPHTNR
eukprot:CAMPEP_0114498330 /NCGR_PEP_ID=MMETSP0109-20121206/6819_1 /TAXON_ID=29199 /ORGANISM="Chlorarachnion reptans, Strain CCCM449" /LENGTH=321 /DNA_ID=CAMNT_0001675809 /DNA_START=60 /DNA_END=1021 /DNA_ORIENTATION=+